MLEKNQGVFSLYLIDENDNEIGFIEKLDAHIKGVLHRAISVFIFNDNKELLLQKRFSGKYGQCSNRSFKSCRRASIP